MRTGVLAIAAFVVYVAAVDRTNATAADWPVWPTGCDRFEGPQKAECLQSIAIARRQGSRSLDLRSAMEFSRLWRLQG